MMGDSRPRWMWVSKPWPFYNTSKNYTGQHTLGPKYGLSKELILSGSPICVYNVFVSGHKFTKFWSPNVGEVLVDLAWVGEGRGGSLAFDFRYLHPVRIFAIQI